MGCTRLTSQHGDGHRNSPMARRWARVASALSSASCCVYVSKSGRAETMLGRPRSRRDGHCCSHPTSASFCQLFNWSGSDSWGSWWRATLQRGLITLLGPVLLAMRSSAISKLQEAPPANCTHEGRWEAQLHLHEISGAALSLGLTCFTSSLSSVGGRGGLSKRQTRGASRPLHGCRRAALGPGRVLTGQYRALTGRAGLAALRENILSC